MRSVIDASSPLPDQSLGTPKMPNKKTNRIAKITTSFQVRFLFMKNQSMVASRQSLANRSTLVRPANDQRPSTNDDLRFPFLRRRHRDHRGAANFELQIIGGNAQRNGIILKADDRPAQPAAGYNLVSIFQFAKHRLPFFLFPLLWHDQQKIKNRKDEKQWG